MSRILTIFIILLTSCTGEPSRYSPTAMWFIGYEFDKTIEQVPIPQHEVHRRILCTSYGAGCVSGSGKRILVRKVEMVVVEFKNEKFARAEALRLNGYYVKNWFFDDVTGEPVLESFVRQAYKAKNPRLELLK